MVAVVVIALVTVIIGEENVFYVTLLKLCDYQVWIYQGKHGY